MVSIHSCSRIKFVGDPLGDPLDDPPSRANGDRDTVGRKLALTGPESPTQEEMVTTIGRTPARTARSPADRDTDHPEYFG